METYISIDIEADGPIPGPYSMLSIGAVAFNIEGEELDDFSVNLRPLSGASQDTSTMRFWAKNPEAWKALQVDKKEPQTAMREFSAWLKTFTNPTLVEYPGGWDFMHVFWYLKNFTGESPVGFSSIGIKTLAMAQLGGDYRASNKGSMPRRWFEDMPPHTHVAVGDAREQGILFFRILRELRQDGR